MPASLGYYHDDFVLEYSHRFTEYCFKICESVALINYNLQLKLSIVSFAI